MLDYPLLAITTIIDDTTTLTTSDYILYGAGPARPKWENGPYTRIDVDPDATNISYWTEEKDIVSITGRWGLYERSKATGATVQDNPLSDSATSLTVDNGGVVPGPRGAAQLIMAHGGETVLPTHKSGVTGGITVNVTGNTLLDDNAGSKIGKQIVDELKLNLRSI